MSMTLSSATAAAKAAQAELTAPVAANSSTAQAANGNGRSSTASTTKPSSNSANSASTSNTAKAGTPARNTSGAQGNPQQPAASQQAARTPAADAVATAQAAQAAIAAAPATAPLFSQLLNLADVAVAASDDSSTDTQSGGDDATGSGSAAASDVLPAMITSMLNVAPPVQAAPQPGADGEAARIDAVSAASSLNTSATRLNLAAAGVAVTPANDDVAAAQAAAAAAAAAPVAAPVVAPQSAAANSAAQAAVAARQADADKPAAAPAPAQAPAPVSADSALPQEQRAVTPPPASYANLPRSTPRVADSGASPVPNTSATATGSADDGNGSVTAHATTVSSVNVTQATVPATSQAATTVKLAGAPEQWQQPLREALGDRLQVQLQRNNDHAVIRLEPPNMGAIEISIRHSAGSLQVNLSASNSDVVRQLNTISDSVRQDLSSRQFADVSVSVSSSRAQAQADQGQGGQGRSGQQRQDDGRTPGRALSDDDSTATFAMTGE